MRSLVARMRRWWVPAEHARSAPVSYEVACACGAILRGLRQARHQVVRCSACRQPIFVLPRSPLPPLPSEAASAAPTRDGSTARPFLKPWHWPFLAAAVTLVAVIVLYAVLLVALARGPAASPLASPASDFVARSSAGQKALASGNFRRATDELSAARALLEQNPGAATAPEGRRIAQLHRQAALLADLLSESLGEILQRAAGLPDEEWQAQFANRYRNHGVVFDADVTRAASGGWQIAFFVRAGPEPARIDGNDLKLLSALPRDRPPRLLFGARLASVRREPPGTWVVRFEPDSGVLLTDRDAVAACCPPPIDDELDALVARQNGWLAGLP
jgi:hypothetical protein